MKNEQAQLRAPHVVVLPDGALACLRCQECGERPAHDGLRTMALWVQRFIDAHAGCVQPIDPEMAAFAMPNAAGEA